MRSLSPNTEAGRSGPWLVYLLAAAVLTPLLLPAGPKQVALIDLVNVLALGLFVIGARPRGIRLQAPFLAPVVLILIGSLLAMTYARSVSQGVWTLAQDAYLYLWFLLLVNVLVTTGRLASLRTAWIVTSAVVAVAGLVLLLVRGHESLGAIAGPSGPRATGTFPNPNYFADYLVLSFFVVLSAAGQIRKPVLAAVGALLLVALIATKSNGGAIALLAGLAAWGLFQAYAKGIRPVAIAGATALVLAVGLLGWNLVSEWGVGAATLSDLKRKSFAERMEHSSDSRIRIWSQLQEAYTRSPLGIGPGNSRFRTVSIEDRARPDASRVKEAHSDYLGYAIERGPIALIGLLMLMGEAFTRLGRFLKDALRKSPNAVWGGAFAAAMIAGLIASSVHSLVVEKLHFRHFWLYMAMIVVGTQHVAARAALSIEVPKPSSDDDTRSIPAPARLRRRRFVASEQMN